MVKAKCLACNKEFVFGLWDFLDLSCECGSTNLEGYVDNELVLHKDSELCERCSSKILPAHWIKLRKKKLCIDCIEKAPIQAIESAQERAEIPQHLKKCIHGHDTVLRENTLNGSKFIGCSRFPHCRWTASMDE